MSGWTDGQVREFARQFAFSNKATWPAYVDDVRDAMIGHHVLNVVLGQDRSGRHDDVSIREIRSLLLRLARVLSDKHHMASPLAEQARDADDADDADADAGDGRGEGAEESLSVIYIRDAAIAKDARCPLCDAGVPRVGGIHVGNHPDEPCERVFATQGTRGRLRGRPPWMAYVDGNPLIARGPVGRMRTFVRASTAYAAAVRAAHAADHSAYVLAEASATNAPIAEHDDADDDPSPAITSESYVKIHDAVTTPARAARCRLCDAGAPRVGGLHVGSQSFGMIPTTPCDRVFVARDALPGSPWLAYVDGEPLYEPSGRLRYFRTPAEGYGAATRSAATRGAGMSAMGAP